MGRQIMVHPQNVVSSSKRNKQKGIVSCYTQQRYISKTFVKETRYRRLPITTVICIIFCSYGVTEKEFPMEESRLVVPRIKGCWGKVLSANVSEGTGWVSEMLYT